MIKPLALLIIGLALYSCSIMKPAGINEMTLLTLAGDTVTAEEFTYLYEKNNFNNADIYTEKDIDNYLELFENFKLKVKAAKAAGIDTTQAFKSEYKTYKDQLIEPYLAESQENSRIVLEAYEHMKYEIDAAHIMVSVSADALPEDTLAAYNKLAGILRDAQSGADFGDLAYQYSEDPSAKTNRGRLGYFTAFQMVYPFESAAYNTPVDSVSGIIRSQFGYHILKVLDRRPYSGKVKVSHIMLLNGSGSEEVLRNKIFEIHEQAIGGADWNELCRKYSEDERTKDTGGTLPLLGLRQINDQAFESAAFSLQNPGDISDPVQSQFGWHIIRLEEKMGLESFEELQENLRQQVARDDRSKLSHKAVIERLKISARFRQDALTKQHLLALADSSILQGKWTPMVPDSLLGASLYFINDRPEKVGEVLDFILKNQRRRTGITPEGYLDELIEKSIEVALINAEEQQIVASNSDVRMLLKEYYEGILLFEIMNRQVWGRASEDTLGLEQYFEDNRDKYQWGERADAYIIETSSETVFKEITNYADSAVFTLSDLSIQKPLKTQEIVNSPLDSLIAVHRSFPQTDFLIQGDTVSCEVINQYLVDNGVPDSLISCRNDLDTENFIALKLNSRSKKSLEFLYNRESALTLRVTEGLFERGKNSLLDSVTWHTGKFSLMNGNDFVLVGINKVLLPQPKKLDETKGAVIADYQQYLDQEWIQRLRQEYAITLNKQTIDKIKSYFKKKHRPSA